MTPTDRLRAVLDPLPFVAILRGIAPADAVPVGQVLADNGWRVVEVPLNSPQPLESISALARSFPDALVGAGTVLRPEQVQEVHRAGARLVVAPNFDAAVVRAAADLGMACLPGVFTATEAFAALDAGATGLKLFPAELMPPAGLKALRAVLPPSTLLFPVGGIAPTNLQAYRDAGANGFGVGSALFQPGRAPASVRVRAQDFASAWTGTIRT